jgi:16S rRNA processing protein RimM
MQEKEIKQQGEQRKPNKKDSPPPPPPIPDGWLEIGTIVAAQGLHGQMRVYPDTDFPERFEQPGTRWLLHPNTKEPQPIELLSGKYLNGKNLYIIELEGIKSRSQAEEMRGCKLLVSEDDRPHLEEGEYHILDLVGLQVFMQESGELIGKVVNLIPAGHDLLEVELHQQENPEQTTNKKKPKNLLIPFVKEIVPVVDIVARRAEITPPSGLLSIND